MEVGHFKQLGPLYSSRTQLAPTPLGKKYKGGPYKTLQKTLMPHCKQDESES
jgi:hypothetical protein